MAAFELLWPKKNLNPGRLGMWIEKLTAGVIRVITPIGPRFIELSFWQRAYFLWIFRNFETLP